MVQPILVQSPNVNVAGILSALNQGRNAGYAALNQRAAINAENEMFRRQLPIEAFRAQTERAGVLGEINNAEQGQQLARDQLILRDQMAQAQIAQDQQQLNMQSQAQQVQMADRERQQRIQQAMAGAVQAGDEEMYRNILKISDPALAAKLDENLLKQRKLIGEIADKDFGMAVKHAEERRRFANDLFQVPEAQRESFLEQNRDIAERLGIKEVPDQDDLAAINLVSNFGLEPKDKMKAEGDLRKEFTQVNKDFLNVDASFKRILASAEDPSAAGDLALIFNYMKVLDPGSTVREGEFANAENSAGIPARLRGQYNKIISGERLAPEVRQDFVNRAGKLYNTAKQDFDVRRGSFENVARRNKLNPENVLIDYFEDPNNKRSMVEGQVVAGQQEAEDDLFGDL